MIAFLVLSACLPPSEPITEHSYSWQGWVSEDLPFDGVGGLRVGEIAVHDTDGNLIATAVQPADREPGNWRIPLTNAQPVAIRISGPEQMTTVWRTTTPARQGYWFSGSFFAVKTQTMTAFWDALSELEGKPMGRSDGAHLYGQTLSLTNADLDAWTGAQITLYDGAGQVHRPWTFSADETGALVAAEGLPISVFTVTDFEPGAVRLVVDASDGRSIVMDYIAEPGDLLGAFAFTLPER
jgi:hypothetical protein